MTQIASIVEQTEFDFSIPVEAPKERLAKGRYRKEFDLKKVNATYLETFRKAKYPE